MNLADLLGMFQMGARSSMDAVQSDVNRVSEGHLPSGLMDAIGQGMSMAPFTSPGRITQYGDVSSRGIKWVRNAKGELWPEEFITKEAYAPRIDMKTGHPITDSPLETVLQYADSLGVKGADFVKAVNDMRKQSLFYQTGKGTR